MDALEFLLAETPDSAEEDAQDQSTDGGVGEWDSIGAIVAASERLSGPSQDDVQLCTSYPRYGIGQRRSASPRPEGIAEYITCRHQDKR